MTIGIRILLMMILLASTSCDSISGPMIVVNETNAKGLLKQYNMAQFFRFTEYHEFGTLKDLNKEMFDMIKTEMFEASDSVSDPKPLNGYYYSEIVIDPDGRDLDPQCRAGLAAYPSEPGKSGTMVIMMLIDICREDLSNAKPEEAVQSSGDEWHFYYASADDIKGPITHWPSESELRLTWRKDRKYTPEEGLKEAQKIADSIKNR